MRFRSSGKDAVLQIAQAFPKSEQAESESQQVVPRRERGGLIVTSILRDDASKITLWKEVDDLSEYETSRVHGNTLSSKSEPKRLKSNGVITRLPLSDYQSVASHQVEIAARI